MPLRLLHFADTHIGVETYGRVDPQTGRHTRLTDFQKALDAAIDLALEAQVHAALFAGDAYRTCDPSPTHQQIFAGAIMRLVAAGVPVAMVAGNHDLPVTFGRVTALDIFRTLVGDRVTVFTRPGLVRLETPGGPLQVVGLPWPTRSVLRAAQPTGEQTEDELREELERLCAEAIGQLAGELEPGVPAVLLAHITAATGVFSGSERRALGLAEVALPRGVLADPRFDYVALGHLHRHQDINHGERPGVVYPGSIERIDFGEADDVKGVCLVTIPDGPSPTERATTWRHVAVPTRRFVQQRVKVPPEVDATEYLLGALRGLDFAGAVVRVHYQCSDEQAATLDLRRVRAALEAAHLVTGLIREAEPEQRRPQVVITEHHSVREALARYLDAHPELAELREDMETIGRELAEELVRSDDGGDVEEAG